MALRFALMCIGLAAAAACANVPAPSPDSELATAPAAAGPPPTARAGAVRVTYLANEGVMLSHGDDVVMIDGLHRFYGNAYLTLADGERADAEAARGRFARVDVVLATHRHGDHFSADAVVGHLANNPNAVFLGAPQLVELIDAVGPPTTVRARVQQVPWQPGASHTRRVGDIQIDFLGLLHINERHAEVHNHGLIVTLGGESYAHFGDADNTAENYARFELPARKLAGAFVPHWFLASAASRAAVRHHIAARRVFAVHIDPRAAEARARELADAFPDAIPMIESLHDY